MPTLHISAHADPDHVRLLGTAFRAVAQTITSAQQAAQLELAVVEACNNIVEHAYAEHAGSIEMDILVLEDKIVVTLQDTGLSMPASSLCEPPLDQIEHMNLDALPEGGFGLFLIRSIMDNHEYTSANGINTLTLTKYLIS
ncbi:MAG: ATP-binding protein [Bacteroidota bacterium]|nr:ATP-binding protein [Candidatus Kapabacteria bacterium]MDW8220302.1 ATP-binding protein [Bacteroidota bacterium]